MIFNPFFRIKWEQDSDEEELLELPDSWTEKDEEPEEYWVSKQTGQVRFAIFSPSNSTFA